MKSQFFFLSLSIFPVLLMCCLLQGCFEGGNLSITKTTAEQNINEVVMGLAKRESLTDLAVIRDYQKRMDGALARAELKLVPEIHHIKSWCFYLEAHLLQYRSGQKTEVQRLLKLAQESFQRAITDTKNKQKYLLGGLIETMLCRFDEKNPEEHLFYSRVFFSLAKNFPEEKDSLFHFNLGEHYYTSEEIEVLAFYPWLYSGYLTQAWVTLQSCEVPHDMPEFLEAEARFFLDAGLPDEAIEGLEIFKSPRFLSYYHYRETLLLLKLAYQGALESSHEVDLKVVDTLLKKDDDFFNMRNLLDYRKDFYISPERKNLSRLLIYPTTRSEEKKSLDDMLDLIKWPNDFLKIDLEYQPAAYREALYLAALLDPAGQPAETLLSCFPSDCYAREIFLKQKGIYETEETDCNYYWVEKKKEPRTDKRSHKDTSELTVEVAVPEDTKDSCRVEFYFYGTDAGCIPEEAALKVRDQDYWLELDKARHVFRTSGVLLKKESELAEVTLKFRDKSSRTISIHLRKPESIIEKKRSRD
ncbi:MAG: hypothetical protein PHW04_10685 [Candidatus Wallbacteria bacterium]|nr:hypothetical protein [Candidatus Wallbacteria bacterium]